MPDRETIKEVKDLGDGLLSERPVRKSDNSGSNNANLLPDEPRLGGPRTGSEEPRSAERNRTSSTDSDSGLDSALEGDDFRGIQGIQGSPHRVTFVASRTANAKRPASFGGEAGSVVDESGTGSIRDEGISLEGRGEDAGSGSARSDSEQELNARIDAELKLPDIGILPDSVRDSEIHDANILTELKTMLPIKTEVPAEEPPSRTALRLVELPSSKTSKKTTEPKRGPGRPRKVKPEKESTKTIKGRNKEYLEPEVAEETEKSPFLVLDSSPLSDAEWKTFSDSLKLISELMDDGEFYLGLETDPEFGGEPIWALEDWEAEIVVESYRVLAENRPRMNVVARQVNMVSTHAEAAIIVGSRVLLSLQRHLAEGLHFRIRRHKEERAESGQQQMDPNFPNLPVPERTRHNVS